jgi:hypothetical protein
MPEQLFFSIKTKEEDSVRAVLNREENVIFSGLNVLENSLTLRQIVFIVFGGDKPSWKTGLVGVGLISKLPYEHDGKNFKVKVDIKFILKDPIKRSDLLSYPDTYDVIGIGPITKWEPNQALSQVHADKAYALFRAMLDIDPSIGTDLDLLLSEEELKIVKGSAKRFVEISVNYNESLPVIKKDDGQIVTTSCFMINYSQTIYYGVPGSGKSYKIEEMTKDLPENQKVRVVFHPDYTNADFVGQIQPNCKDDTVSYRFTPGPFTKILRRAYCNPDKPYYLIIEEINRGNAAAIFGELFQLLDRIKLSDTADIIGGNGYSQGWSKYFVDNDFINSYIRNKHEFNEAEYSDAPDQYKLEIPIADGIKFTPNTGIRLPPNLSILATMNTSDQNVFTLDNAFQRRWTMELVPNVLDVGKAQYKLQIDDTGVTWGIFLDTVNNKICETADSTGVSSMEDKRLGSWFITADSTDGKKVSAKLFAEKVLKYLWDDAFRLNRDELFSADYSSFEQLAGDFTRVGNDHRFSVLKISLDQTVLSENISIKTSPPAETASE